MDPATNEFSGTDAELIEALGDTAKVAAAFEIHPNRVSDWKKRGIPADYKAGFGELADAQGIRLPRAWFGPEPVA